MSKLYEFIWCESCKNYLLGKRIIKVSPLTPPLAGAKAVLLEMFKNIVQIHMEKNHVK